METLKWKIFKPHACLYAHTRIFWSREGRVSQITWFDFSDCLNDVYHLSTGPWQDCWYRQRENQSLWFSWAFSCFLFFSRLILSESLLYFTGEQSRHFLLTKPFPVFKILFSLFISVSWLALFFLSAQVRVFTVWHLVHAFLLRLRTKGKNCSIVYSKRKMSYNLLLVLAVCIQAKWPIRPALISVPCSMKLLGVFLLPPPPGWDGSPSLEGLLEH